MISAPGLLAFLLLAAGIVLTPGPDMAVITGGSLGAGLRGGLAALAGVLSGGAVHVTAAAVGLSALIAASERALDVLAVASSLYLLWLGWGLLRSRASAHETRSETSAWSLWRAGAATNLLNPKAYLFMFAVFPQFIVRDGWPAGAQAAALGLVLLTTAGALYSAIAVAATRLRTAGGGRWGLAAARLTGVYFLVLAVGMPLARFG
jgi:threonine/homoserine/homoserine lactone efflux protein